MASNFCTIPQTDGGVGSPRPMGSPKPLHRRGGFYIRPRSLVNAICRYGSLQNKIS